MAAAELANLAAPASPPPRRGLSARPWAGNVALGAFALLFATALAAGAELVEPAVFTSRPPHPVLRPTAGAIAAIFTTNLRVLAAPFLLIAFKFASDRRAAVLGDALIAAILIANAAQVGLAIGRWQTRLLPYLPNLPLEYLAAAAAGAAWLNARRRRDERQLQALRASAGYAAATVILLAAAACVEVLLTPHRS
jgi:Stage II sporulation protein M